MRIHLSGQLRIKKRDHSGQGVNIKDLKKKKRNLQGRIFSYFLIRGKIIVFSQIVYSLVRKYNLSMLLVRKVNFKYFWNWKDRFCER